MTHRHIGTSGHLAALVLVLVLVLLVLLVVVVVVVVVVCGGGGGNRKELKSTGSTRSKTVMGTSNRVEEPN